MGAFGPRIWPEGMRAVTGTRSGLSGGLAFPSACCHSLRSCVHGHPECSKVPACTLLCPILIHTQRTPAGTSYTQYHPASALEGDRYPIGRTGCRGQDTWVGKAASLPRTERSWAKALRQGSTQARVPCR